MKGEWKGDSLQPNRSISGHGQQMVQYLRGFVETRLLPSVPTAVGPSTS
jgi:hypothetical protein